MDQVLFWIPIRTEWTPNGLPVYGFGAMLFLAFVIGSWIAGRRALRVGIPVEKLQDLVILIFIFGLVGGRVLYFVAEEPQNFTWGNFFKIWNGGLVFYGGAIGGAIGGILAYRWLMKPLGVSFWQVADVLAPAVAVGLCLGRLGCFLNGCCYGQVAAPNAPAVCFPSLTAPARDKYVTSRGHQTLAGFAMDDRAKDDRTVGFVEAGSPAEAAGLKPGDVILAVNGHEVPTYGDLDSVLRADEWPQGKTHMALEVRRGEQTIQLAPFKPRLIGLYPAQVYESISALLLFFALIATYPLRRYDGQIMALLMLGYAVHRYVNEMLRDDTPRYYFGLTLSQSISLGIFLAGLAIALLRRRHPRAVAS